VTDAASAIGPIPVPADFPVVWDAPEDAQALWQIDRMHFPDPLLPMEYAFVAYAMAQINWAREQYGQPMRTRSRLINHYSYMSGRPIAAPPEKIESMTAAGTANVRAATERLPSLWSEEFRPEIEQHLAAWQSFDLAASDLPSLVAHFDGAIERFKRCWQLHFLLVSAMHPAMSALTDLCRELFDDQSALGPYRLMQGLPNTSFQGGRALWQLSRRAGTNPEVAQAILESPPDRRLGVLAGSVAGRAFRAELDAYLAVWGMRGERMDVGSPSQIEDPTSVLDQIADNLRNPGRDFDADFARRVAEREQAEAEARSTLAGYPAPVRERFETALRLAQAATVISEEHNYLIDFQCAYQVRRILLALGDRLTAAGALAAPADIFTLDPDELRAAALATPPPDLRDLAESRRASLARARAIDPPRALGTRPPPPPPTTPQARAAGQFFGAPQPASVPGEVRGNPGSSGRARGPVTIVRTLADGARLKPGDVLVATTTASSWTPLFATAVAVVTETGGPLSHSAVVAREYGIPAVVGASDATDRLTDGQIVEVDGDAGVIRLVEA
jgi:pyruvate,water dikinase